MNEKKKRKKIKFVSMWRWIGTSPGNFISSFSFRFVYFYCSYFIPHPFSSNPSYTIRLLTWIYWSRDTLWIFCFFFLVGYKHLTFFLSFRLRTFSWFRTAHTNPFQSISGKFNSLFFSLSCFFVCRTIHRQIGPLERRTNN